MPDIIYNVPENVITPWSYESIGSTLGMVAGGVPGTSSAAYPTGSLCIYIPFYTTSPYIVKSVFSRNGGTVAGNIDIGVYSKDRVKLFSTGALLQSGTTTMQVTQLATPYELGAGLFFMGVCMSNPTGTLLASSFIAGNTGTGLVSLAGVYQQPGNATLPSTGTFSAPIADYIPLIGISNKAIV